MKKRFLKFEYLLDILQYYNSLVIAFTDHFCSNNNNKTITLQYEANLSTILINRIHKYSKPPVIRLNEGHCNT
jgi:hypothetical protein